MIFSNSNAQNDSMYVMKSGKIVGYYKVSEVDSIIFYKPIMLNEPITDIEGNVYNTVTIGAQVWMKENLKTSKYNNGDNILTTPTGNTDISGEINTKYQWVYFSNSYYLENYGRLYTWYAATDNRNICPSGWHLPTDAEWTTLSKFLGGDSVAANKLKETGTDHWKLTNTDVTNETEFSAGPGGNRSTTGEHQNAGDYGFWWTSSESSSVDAWCRYMYSDSKIVGRGENYKMNAFSVRCVKD